MTDKPCCVAYHKHEQRTPMLFKTEFDGHYLIATNCKTYHAGRFTDSKIKQSTKGISKIHSNLNETHFIDVLATKKACKGQNISFMTKGSDIYTYKQERVGLSYLYYKRVVCPDGYRTLPTDV